MCMIFTFMKRINKCYTGSHFLGHAIAEETFQSIQAVHGKLDLTRRIIESTMTLMVLISSRVAVVDYMFHTVLMEQYRKLQTGI